MAATYTRRLGSAQLTAPGQVLLFTADSQFTYVIRDVVAANQSSAAAQLQVYISSGSHSLTVLLESSVPAGTSSHFDGRVALLPGDQVFYNTTAQGFSSCVVTGYELT